MSQLYILKEDNPLQGNERLGGVTAGWRTPSRRGMEGGHVRLCVMFVSVCPARPNALADGGMAICRGQAPVPAGVCAI